MQRASQPIRITSAPVRVSVAAQLAGWVARGLVQFLILIVISPAAMASLTVAVGLVWLYRWAGWWPVILVVVLAVGG